MSPTRILIIIRDPTSKCPLQEFRSYKEDLTSKCSLLESSSFWGGPFPSTNIYKYVVVLSTTKLAKNISVFKNVKSDTSDIVLQGFLKERAYFCIYGTLHWSPMIRHVVSDFACGGQTPSPSKIEFLDVFFYRIFERLKTCRHPPPSPPPPDMFSQFRMLLLICLNIF